MVLITLPDEAHLAALLRSRIRSCGVDVLGDDAERVVG